MAKKNKKYEIDPDTIELCETLELAYTEMFGIDPYDDFPAFMYFISKVFQSWNEMVDILSKREQKHE